MTDGVFGASCLRKPPCESLGCSALRCTVWHRPNEMELSHRWRKRALPRSLVLKSSKSYSSERPAVGWSDWLGLWRFLLIGFDLVGPGKRRSSVCHPMRPRAKKDVCKIGVIQHNDIIEPWICSALKNSP